MDKMIFEEVCHERQAGIVEKLARGIWGEYYLPIIGRDQVDYMVAQFQSVAAVLQQMREGHRYFIFRRKGQDIGYLAVFLDQVKREAFVSKLYLCSSCRGQGLGREALAFVESLAREAGMTVMTLTVNKKNSSSIGFYERMGFSKARRVVKDIGQGFVMDDWLMEKHVVETGRDL